MRSVVVVPTYNEAENVERLIAEVHAVVPHVDIVVVDNYSPDGTGGLVEAIAQRDARVRLLPCSTTRGFSQAYINGFKDCLARGYDLISQMDCDLSHQPRYLADFFRLIADNDVVIGSRYMAGGMTKNWPLRRRLLSRCGNVYARLVLGHPLTDLTGGFKCWRRTALEAINLDAVTAVGFAFQMEMNYRAWKMGMRITETPIVFPNRTQGESKMAVNEFWESLEMVRRLRRLKL